MFGRIKRNDAKKEETTPKEGDLYARIQHEGRTFELYYGYYEECDRQNPMVPPMPVYPNFIERPQYDDEGCPFVTEMQDVCQYFEGKNPDDGCYRCRYYQRVLEFIGICTCAKRRK